MRSTIGSNNLQTVAALLRLQGRRMDAPEARLALEEAVRRVGTIAIVHETLSQTFDEQVGFDEIADRLSAMVTEVAAGGGEVVTSRSGSFGRLPAAVATPLAMVLTELLQNAVEHAFGDAGGDIDVRVLRLAGRLEVVIDDDGRGLPDGFDPALSGPLRPVDRTLVESELGASSRWVPDRGVALESTSTCRCQRRESSGGEESAETALDREPGKGAASPAGS